MTVRDEAAGVPSPVARVVDVALEATVVGSFSRIGPLVRRPTARWRDAPAAAGRHVVVTGSTSGLGLAAARRLAAQGAHVVLVGRDAERTDEARRAVAQAAGGAPVDVALADLGDLDQVRRLTGELVERHGRIDTLIHNAGALFPERREAPDGTELTVTLHLLAPYLLTEGLLGVLRASRPSRVITMTSGGMYTQRFDLGDLVMGPEGYDGSVAYARAKRAQVVLTREWQRRYGGSGVDFHVVHPGWADTPGLAAGLPGFARIMGPLLRSPDEGADTLVWLGGEPDGEPAGGRLWLDRRPRSEYRLPQTWASPARRLSEGRALWEWAAARTNT